MNLPKKGQRSCSPYAKIVRHRSSSGRQFFSSSVPITHHLHYKTARLYHHVLEKPNQRVLPQIQWTLRRGTFGPNARVDLGPCVAISAVFTLSLPIALGSISPSPVMVMVTVGKVVSVTRVVAVGTSVALGMTGPGPSGNAEGPAVKVTLLGAATARLLAMLDMPMLRRDETFWMIALALANSIDASPLVSDATASRMDDSRSDMARDIRLFVVLADVAEDDSVSMAVSLGTSESFNSPGWWKPKVDGSKVCNPGLFSCSAMPPGLTR